ncbi:MAG: aluminum resistance protein, partial [Paenibacillus sp.]|nr:aluminum resistance protein [Paenibacillus sp.]
MFEMIVPDKIARLMEEAEAIAEPKLKLLDKRVDRNQWKVIGAFQKHKVSDYHFAGSTGYG